MVGDVRTKIKVIGAHVSLAAAGRVYLISFWSGSNPLLIIKYRNFYKNSDHFYKHTCVYNISGIFAIFELVVPSVS